MANGSLYQEEGYRHGWSVHGRCSGYGVQSQVMKEKLSFPNLHALGKMLPKPLYKAALYPMAHFTYS